MKNNNHAYTVDLPLRLFTRRNTERLLGETPAIKCLTNVLSVLKYHRNSSEANKQANKRESISKTKCSHTFEALPPWQSRMRVTHHFECQQVRQIIFVLCTKL